jgi:hypothetical protein
MITAARSKTALCMVTENDADKKYIKLKFRRMEDKQ